MKTSLLTTAALCCAAAGFSHVAFADPSPAPSPSPKLSAAPTGNVSLYNGFLLGTKIVGCHVKNLQSQDLGIIDDLIVNPDTGRVRFAVLGLAGPGGTGSAKIVVPWGAISLEKNQEGQAPSYVLDATKDKLEKAPKFDANKLADLYAATRPVFDYYSITFFDDLPSASPSSSPNK